MISKMKITYLRVILTNCCNMKCPYCHSEGNEKGICNSLSKAQINKMLEAFYLAGIKKFKFMGGEPTLRKDLPEIIKSLRNLDKEIDISIISNGIFEKEFIDECFKCGLNRVNISVHAWSDHNLMKSVGISEIQMTIIKNNLEYLSSIGKLSKINYVYLENADKNELIELIDWVNEHKEVLDILNLLSKKEDIFYQKNYAPFNEIENFLYEKFNIVKSYIKENKFSLSSKRLVLNKGGEINLKVFPLNQNKPFIMCDSCDLLPKCTEGIKAIRLTSEGILRPCLFKYDNCLDLSKTDDVYELTDKVKGYLNQL